jgi:hypothetical protein
VRVDYRGVGVPISGDTDAMVESTEGNQAILAALLFRSGWFAADMVAVWEGISSSLR